MPNTITIEPVDLAKQKIIEPRLCEVELGEDRFIYRLKFRTSEPVEEDEGLPWVEVDSDFHFVFKGRSLLESKRIGTRRKSAGR